MKLPLDAAWQFHLLGYPVRLAEPAYLAISVLAILGPALAVVGYLRRAGLLAGLAPGRLSSKVVPGASPGRALSRSLLAWGALLFGGLALSQPECGSHTELSKKYGIDLVIALDASRSMLARDVKPSRIERAKLELLGLLDKLKGDRVAIVVFAGDAFVQCPLTNDYAAAKMFLRAVDPANMPVQGTDLSRALLLGRDLLMEADRGAKSRAIVVLSDGEDFGDGLDETITTLKNDAIRVITVGIGSEAGEPIPELDKKGNMVGYKKDLAGNTVMSRLDARGLENLADKTEGVFVPSVPGSVGVGQVAEELDRMQKAELESRITVSYEERFIFFLGPALALLVLSLTLRPGRPRQGVAWGAGGFLQGAGAMLLAALGAATLIEPTSTLDAEHAKALQQLIIGVQAGSAVACFALAMVLDLFVDREEAA